MLDKEILNVSDYAISIRRKLHENPELSFKEYKTTEMIADELKKLGLEVQIWDDITGAVGLLKYSEDMPTIGLRADIDALPIQEKTGLPFASKNPGVMHACAHDAHTAILLGVAKVLSQRTVKPKANVKFIFQPAEEVPPGGAVQLIDRGVLENPKMEVLWACHHTTSLPVGKIGICQGSFLASADQFKMIIKCKGGHGADPHQGVDGIAVATQIITAIQYMVTREIAPVIPTVISIGSIHAGNRPNILANHVEIVGTCRTLDKKVREELPERILALSQGIASIYGAQIELDYEKGYPPLVNNDWASEILKRGAESAIGKDNVVDIPSNMSGDDLAYFFEKVPGAYFVFGTTNLNKGKKCAAHTPDFDIDEDSIPVAMNVFLNAIDEYIKQA